MSISQVILIEFGILDFGNVANIFAPKNFNNPDSLFLLLIYIVPAALLSFGDQKFLVCFVILSCLGGPTS